MEIIEEIIPVETYCHLRKVCGLSTKTIEAATIAMHHTLYSVMLKEGSEIIGMGRVIGDGGSFCQVTDICVLPDYQKKGLGKIIMQNIVHFIENKLPESCYVSLIADGDAFHLYKQFGFKETFPASRGMFLKVGKKG